MLNIVSVYLNDLPSASTIPHGGIFAGHDICLGGELNVVGIVEHDKVVEPKIACNAGSSKAYFLLNATIAYIGVDSLLLECWVASLGIEELCSNGSTNGIGVTLSKRTAAVLDATFVAYLRMTWCGRAPLTQLLQLLECELLDERQFSIKHRTHVSRVEEEAVATFPSWVLGVELHVFAVEDVDEVSATHSSAWVSTLCFLHHCCCQDADVVGSTIH